MRYEPAYLLTAREREVLGLVARGMKSVAIGHKLGISHRTAEQHVRSAMWKLRCHDRTSAVLLAIQLEEIEWPHV